MKRLKRAFVLSCLLPFSSQASWFQSDDSLISLHEKLLDNQLQEMFSLLVQHWQLPDQKMAAHLDGLLIQAQDIDCGRSLVQSKFPSWLQSVTLTQVVRERAGRNIYQFEISALSPLVISDMALIPWNGDALELDSLSAKERFIPEKARSYTSYLATYNLNQALSTGLYQLRIRNGDDTWWEQWVVIPVSQPEHSVRWASRDTWVVDKHQLLNEHCPLPSLSVSIGDYEKGQYTKYWSKRYEVDYPGTIPQNALPPKRYVVNLSMTTTRRQGLILLKQRQVISKTIDLTE